MNLTLEKIIKDHFKKYPHMMIEDYVKLIYQQSFGPSHFSKKPEYTQIASYLIKELEETKENLKIDKVEYIGHHYYRLSLDLVRHGELSVHDLSDMFLKSMELSSELTDELKQCFLKKIDILLALIQNKEIDLDYDESLKYIKSMVKEGIKASHHSESYQLHYQPTYRVVHDKFIPKTILKKYQPKAN
jgi:hypothetical protein